MGHGSRIDEFRKKRYRAAVRRKGAVHRRPPPMCRQFRGFLHSATEETLENGTELKRGLWHLARRVHRYPGVAGILYRRADDTVSVRLVVPRPMTRLMRLLTSAWGDEIRNLYPSYSWRVHVTPDAPHDDQDSYRCLYWRTT